LNDATIKSELTGRMILLEYQILFIFHKEKKE